MGLTLKDLRTVMAPLSQLGKGELTFDVDGTAITLRALTPDEELNVARHARAALAEGDGTDQATAMDYLDRFRNMSLGYSIVQVGTLDFRGVDMIETGAKLPNGVAVKVKKHDALLEILGTWSRNMITAVFRKFGELTARVEQDVEKVITFEEVDFDAEIARLEERLADMKEQKVRHDLSVKDPRTEMRDRVLSSTPSRLAPSRHAPQPTSGASEDVFPKREESAAGFIATSDIVREVAVEEGDEEGEMEMPLPVAAPIPTTPRKPMLAARPVAPPTPQAVDEGNFVDPLADVDSSFADITSPAAMEAENRRILEMRSGAARAPHFSAREAFKEVVGTEGVEAMQATPTGKIGGVDVYKMPTQNLSDRKAGPVRNPVTAPNTGFRPTK